MAVAKLIAEALATAALGELTDRLRRPDSELRRWLDEVTAPPPDTDLRSRRTYSGFFYVIRSRIRRALVVEHHRGGPEPRGSGRFDPSVFEAPPDYDDEFPGFG